MNAVLTSIFDALFAPVARWDPGLVLALFSLATAVVMLAVFRLVSRPEAIRRAKGKVVAHVLAIRLFPDDPLVTLRCLGGALVSNLGYLRHAAVPILVMVAPVVLILLQLDLRFARRPLEPGETAVVGIRFASRDAAELTAAGPADADFPALELPAVELPDVELLAPEGVVVERGPLRIPSLGEVCWRIRAASPGRHELRFGWGRTEPGKDVGEEAGKEVGRDVGSEVAKDVAKDVVVASGRPLERVVPARVGGSSFWASLLAPGERPLGGMPPEGRPSEGIAGAAVGAFHPERITVDYPPRTLEILGLRMHWLVAYFILSLGFAFLLKRPFGVEA